MELITDCASGEKALITLLGLSRRPVGVRLIDRKDQYDSVDVEEPKSGLPYCTAVAYATHGKSHKLDVLHNRCAAASTALGMLPTTEYRLSGRMHAELKVYADIDVSRSVASDMVYCPDEHHGVLIRPLGECSPDPDIAIVVARPKAVMRILHGYAYHYGQLKGIKMAGMCAICQECTSFPLVKGDMNVSMLCAGTRCVGGWQEDELAVGIPFARLSKVIDGVWNTINPMESAPRKTELIQQLKEQGLPIPEIELHRNYYSKAYGIPKDIPHK